MSPKASLPYINLTEPSGWICMWDELSEYGDVEEELENQI